MLKQKDLIFKRRIGPDPHHGGLLTAGASGCPDLWELADGDFAVIGFQKTRQLKQHLPDSASCGHDEAIVVIPRSLLINAKSHIPHE